MGIAGMFLREREKIELYQIVDEVKQIVDAIGYVYKRCLYHEFKSKYESDYFTINIYEHEGSERQLLVYIFDKENRDEYNSTFDFVKKGAGLEQIINFENFSEHEDMLLKFAYEYFKRFPDDFFYDELDWYYTKADIDAIVEKPYDWRWCYRRPEGNRNQKV